MHREEEKGATFNLIELPARKHRTGTVEINRHNILVRLQHLIFFISVSDETHSISSSPLSLCFSEMNVKYTVMLL